MNILGSAPHRKRRYFCYRGFKYFSLIFSIFGVLIQYRRSYAYDYIYIVQEKQYFFNWQTPDFLHAIQNE